MSGEDQELYFMSKYRRMVEALDCPSNRYVIEVKVEDKESMVRYLNDAADSLVPGVLSDKTLMIKKKGRPDLIAEYWNQHANGPNPGRATVRVASEAKKELLALITEVEQHMRDNPRPRLNMTRH